MNGARIERLGVIRACDYEGRQIQPGRAAATPADDVAGRVGIPLKGCWLVYLVAGAGATHLGTIAAPDRKAGIAVTVVKFGAPASSIAASCDRLADLADARTGGAQRSVGIERVNGLDLGARYIASHKHE